MTGHEVVPGIEVQGEGQKVDVASVRRDLEALDVASDGSGRLGIEYLTFHAKHSGEKVRNFAVEGRIFPHSDADSVEIVGVGRLERSGAAVQIGDIGKTMSPWGSFAAFTSTSIASPVTALAVAYWPATTRPASEALETLSPAPSDRPNSQHAARAEASAVRCSSSFAVRTYPTSTQNATIPTSTIDNNADRTMIVPRRLAVRCVWGIGFALRCSKLIKRLA